MAKSLVQFVDNHRQQLDDVLSKYDSHKIQFVVKMKFVKTPKDEKEENISKVWMLSNEAKTYDTGFLLNGAHLLDEKIAHYEACGSNWAVEKIHLATPTYLLRQK